MKEKITPYFGGLWAAADEPDDPRRLRIGMHFFGTMYLVFFGLEKPSRIETSMYHYVLDADEMSMQQLFGDETKDMPITEVRWRFVEGRYLEFVEGKKISLWEPAKMEELVKEGYPAKLFESLRNHFIDIGSFYTTEALVPDRSVFEALRRRSKRKGR